MQIYGGVCSGHLGNPGVPLRITERNLGGGVVGSGIPGERDITVEGLRLYQVGMYKDLKAKSEVGDELEIHHAVQSHVVRQVIPGYDRSRGPSIALTEDEHQRGIRHEKGAYEGTARGALSDDIRKLRLGTDAPNSSLQSLVRLNKSQYPGAFKKF